MIKIRVSYKTFYFRTTFETPKGEMSGFFTYQRLQESENVPSHKLLKVPLFTLAAPEVDENLGKTGEL